MGRHRVGNSTALPGLVVSVCRGAVQMMVPSGLRQGHKLGWVTPPATALFSARSPCARLLLAASDDALVMRVDQEEHR